VITNTSLVVENATEGRKSADLLTLGDISRAFGVRQHVAAYAIREYDIAPRQRAGIIRLWGRDQLSEIKSAILRVAARRGKVAHA
jgi:hypothetical protein